MFNYRDMTFCTHWKECKDGKGCYRALTDEESARAERVGMPVCVFSDRPDCFEE